jgi:penicillin-binding protein 1A
MPTSIEAYSVTEPSKPDPAPLDPTPLRFGRDAPRRPVLPPPRRRVRPWPLVVAVLVAGVLGAIGVGLLAAKSFLDNVPDVPDRQALMIVNQAPGMTFEDTSGKILATRGPKHGSAVTLAELPVYVPRAFLAAEDRRFYEHGPVDFQGIARAAWTNWRAGHTVQGGSTLTQQLARTLYLTPKQTIQRKLEESVIAYRLEQEMSKDEVLELYLNRIFFGDNAYGIDAAAQTYFGKPASQLDLAQAALLASLPKAPTRLALTNDMDAALARSHLVLATMHAQGWISEADEQTALAHPPKLAPEAPGEGDFGYVLDMAAAQAVQIAGGQAPDLVVRLTVDSNLQTTAQAVVREAIDTEGRRTNIHQGALVLLAPDGAIRALVGGRDHQLSAYNRATQAERQPGSSFKPFVYAAALENGVKPTDTRDDAPIRIGLWSPGNYGGGYRGPVTVATALAHSINTVAVRLASEVGPAKIAEVAHRFGLKSIPDAPQMSIALGAYEVNLLELTSAFQVFQQGGQRSDPYLIDQIATQRGDVIFAHPQASGVLVYDVNNAGEMVRMLEGVITMGTGTRAAFGRPAAGKTGTTQDWKDAWFVGFTPDWVCGVWVGNDDGDPTRQVTGGQVPAEIWRRMMIAAHQNVPVHDFAWLPAETPADQTASEVAVSDAPPQAEDQRSNFYGGLSNDFGRAADGEQEQMAEPPPDDQGPPPEHYPAPRPERGDDQDRPPPDDLPPPDDPR